MTRPVTTGLGQLLEQAHPLAGRRVALAAHGAAILPDGRHALDALLAAGVQVVAVLGPEHGFRSGALAGSSEASATDPATGVPVLDCYLASPERLAGLLTLHGVTELVVDFQDAGARFYTYPSTLCDLLAAAARIGVPVTVLDRPNPLGGELRAGPVLDAAHRSFIGRLAMPLRHGCTIGEIARLAVEELELDCALEVVPMAGWDPGALFAQTGLPWLPPSPDLPSPTAALCYVGTGLVEGSSLSEGRGTTTPFEVVAAPFMDHRLAATVRAVGLPGVAISEEHLTPRWGPWQGQPLVGVGLHVGDAALFDPVRTALEVLSTARRLWPGEVTVETAHFDLLAGTDGLRRALEAGEEPAVILASYLPGVAAFSDRVAPLLLYPRTGSSRTGGAACT